MRPAFRIDGHPAPLLDRDVIEAIVAERADGARCSVTLLNWGDVDGAPGYPHFDGPLEPGHAMNVTLTDGLVFTGTIDTIEARYPGDQVPTLVVGASGTLPDTPAGASPQLTLGATLRTCSVRWTHAGPRGDQSTLAEGTTEFDARLRVGVSIELDGLGDPVDGAYHLVEVRHRYDGAGGLRSEFSAIRRAWVA
jgi:hypothetical protein